MESTVAAPINRVPVEILSRIFNDTMLPPRHRKSATPSQPHQYHCQKSRRSAVALVQHYGELDETVAAAMALLVEHSDRLYRFAGSEHPGHAKEVVLPGDPRTPRRLPRHHIQASKCHLTTLTLEDCSLHLPKTLQFLDAISMLHILVLRGGIPLTVTDNLLDALTILRGQKIYLPSLTALHLSGAYFFRDAALCEMLQTRISPYDGDIGVKKLEVADITILHRTVAAADVQALKALGGIEISV
ncbi:hypothetical protein C8R44DRAFT_728363 [Mycena epipterygia]|nr:hypothetical protein C8R44DRAFT_728363 [Mycena epipterygia]